MGITVRRKDAELSTEELRLREKLREERSSLAISGSVYVGARRMTMKEYRDVMKTVGVPHPQKFSGYEE